MNWEAIGAVGEVVGAIAVVSTIGYLAIQIRDSRRDAKAVALDTIMKDWAQAIYALGETQEVASITQRALADYNQLEQQERFVFHVRMDALVIAYWKARTLDDSGSWDMFQELDVAIARFLTSPGGRQWWDSAGHVYPNSKEINELLSAPPTNLEPFSETSFLSSVRKEVG